MQKSSASNFKEITEQYQVSYIELDKDLAVDKVCDIFTELTAKAFDLMSST